MTSRLVPFWHTAAAVLLAVLTHFPLPSSTTPMCTPPKPRVRIVDEAVSTAITSASAVGDPSFRSFISSQTTFLSNRLASLPACLPVSTTLSLTFVRLPLTASPTRKISPPPSLPAGSGPAICRLDSPWLRLRRSTSSPARLDVVYIWNERQLLWDQLLLRNPASPAQRVLMPLNDSDFQRLADLYSDRVVMIRLSPTDPALRRAIPADILWLFSRSPQSTRGPFAIAVLNTMPDFTRSALPATNALSQALVNRCLTTRSANFTFASLMDLQGVFDISRLRLPTGPR
jgi:hypothetical protein